MTLMDQLRGHADAAAPRITSVFPPAAMPEGVVDLYGTGLGSTMRPTVSVGDVPGQLLFTSSTHVSFRVPEGAVSGDLLLTLDNRRSNALALHVATPLAENLHPIANPVVDSEGNLYATFSGARGQEVPVSIFRIGRDMQVRPFVRGLPNASGLAFGPDGFLYCSSRVEGTVYRIASDGTRTQWVEGLGIATGVAFDGDGNLYVGDRSGTIFKLNTQGSTFVFATLEPSVSAYHLAFTDDGTLLVTGPTTSSNEAIYAISPEGEVSTWYRGLGRPQGMALDADGNVYVAASLHGERGIVRITPEREASIAVSGSGLVGLAFLGDGTAALATSGALYSVEMGVDGLLGM